MSLKLITSGEIQGDIYDNYASVQCEVEEAINTVLEGKIYGDSVIKWYHIPIILALDSPDYCEVKRYYKKKRHLEFRLRIPHDEFKNATPLVQRKLFMGMILCSINEMKIMLIPNFDIQKLEADIRELAAAKGWL